MPREGLERGGGVHSHTHRLTARPYAPGRPGPAALSHQDEVEHVPGLGRGGAELPPVVNGLLREKPGRPGQGQPGLGCLDGAGRGDAMPCDDGMLGLSGALCFH